MAERKNPPAWRVRMKGGGTIEVFAWSQAAARREAVRLLKREVFSAVKIGQR